MLCPLPIDSISHVVPTPAIILIFHSAHSGPMNDAANDGAEPTSSGSNQDRERIYSLKYDSLETHKFITLGSLCLDEFVTDALFTEPITSS